jgi:nicotinate phosphoribosyltransferase
MTTGFLTDHYEFTMLDSFVQAGKHNDEAVFEVFSRSLPKNFRYGVFAGLGRLLPMIANFKFDGAHLSQIAKAANLSDATVDYLRGWRFKGDIIAYREGDLYFPNSPVLTVKGTLGECVLLETLILSVLNHDSAIAGRAARMVQAAQGRPIIEMGSRRTHESAAVAAARAAYIAGFAYTSNMAAGKAFGVPTTGTAAHAFTLAFDDEYEAFVAQIKAQGVGTTLLVDTYDIEQGIANAVKAAQEFDANGPGAVRIDSGDLTAEVTRARRQLNTLGATETRIVVSSDLDEYVMKDIAHSPVDGFGVGTKLVSTPPAGFVYKLVQINGRHVAKKAEGKVSYGGEKRAYRVYTNGYVTGEFFINADENLPEEPNVEPLQTLAMGHGQIEHVAYKIDQIKDFHASRMETLPKGERKVWIGDFPPYINTVPLN